jgi:hypothetical protein
LQVSFRVAINEAELRMRRYGMKSFFACALFAIGVGAIAALPAAQAAPAPSASPLPPGLGKQGTVTAQEVDVALVLAVDVSGSIDYEEAELQRKGIVDAFMSREVIQAIQAGSLGRIGVSVVYFSSRDYGVMSVPVNWMVVQDQASATAFVKALVAARRPSARGTSISDALELSMRMIETGPYHSVKQVIDVSGDGVNNAGRPVQQVREEVLSKGITINGLAIIDYSTPQDLDKYFEACVIGGPAAFALEAKGFTDFARAMRRKLVLEISGLTPADMPEGNPLIIKVAASNAPSQKAAPAPVLPVRPVRPQTNSPYAGGCDFPMFGGGFGNFGNFGFR